MAIQPVSSTILLLLAQDKMKWQVACVIGHSEGARAVNKRPIILCPEEKYIYFNYF
jgi:hypothetical protein